MSGTTRTSFLDRLITPPGMMEAARASLGGRWLRFGDTRLYYEQTGQGSEPVVFVTSSSLGFWRLAWPFTGFEDSERYSAIAIATSRPGRDLPRLLRGLGLQRIVLVIDSGAAGPILRLLGDTGVNHVRGLVWIAHPRRAPALHEREAIARVSQPVPVLFVVPGTAASDLTAWVSAHAPTAQVSALSSPAASAPGQDELLVVLQQFLGRLD